MANNRKINEGRKLKFAKVLSLAADAKHVHDEIIAIVNQRFLIVTVAIATFATFTGWLFPEIMSSRVPTPTLYLAPTVLLLVFIGLFLVSHQLLDLGFRDHENQYRDVWKQIASGKK